MTTVRVPPTYAAFPAAEHRGRLDRARRVLAEAGLDGAVVVAPEHLCYLAGYDSWVSVNSPQALIFGTGDDEPTLVLRNVDLPLALETSWVRDIRIYHLHLQDVPALIAQVVAEKRIGRNGKLAIETQSYALTHALGLSLAQALAPIVFVDATELLGELRVIKITRRDRLSARGRALCGDRPAGGAPACRRRPQRDRIRRRGRGGDAARR